MRRNKGDSVISINNEEFVYELKKTFHVKHKSANEKAAYAVTEETVV